MLYILLVLPEQFVTIQYKHTDRKINGSWSNLTQNMLLVTEMSSDWSNGVVKMTSNHFVNTSKL